MSKKEKKVVHKRVPHSCEWDELFKRESLHQHSSSYRNMLDNIHIGCCVSASRTMQHGSVVGIIRDRNGVPVCVKVKYEDEYPDKIICGYDYISVERIDFYEPFNVYVPDCEYDYQYDNDDGFDDDEESEQDD